MSARETPALLRGAQALATELGEDIDPEHYSEASAVVVAALDRDEITEAIMARWLTFAQDGTQQTTREFAEQFADTIITTITGES